MLDNSMSYRIMSILDYLGKPREKHANYVGRIVYRPTCTQNCARLPLIGPKGNVNQTLSTSNIFKIVEDEQKVIIYTNNSVFVLEKLGTDLNPSKKIEIHFGNNSSNAVLLGPNGIKEVLHVKTITGLFSEYYALERSNKEQVIKIFIGDTGQYKLQETLFDLSGYTIAVFNDSIYPIHVEFGYLKDAAIVHPGTTIERTF